jgi:hypothetical protein
MCMYLYASLSVKISLLLFLRRIFVKGMFFANLATIPRYRALISPNSLAIRVDELVYYMLNDLPSPIFALRLSRSSLPM